MIAFESALEKQEYFRMEGELKLVKIMFILKKMFLLWMFFV